MNVSIKTNYWNSWKYYFHYYLKNWKQSLLIVFLSITLSIVTIFLPTLGSELQKAAKNSVGKMMIYFSSLIISFAVIKIIFSSLINYIGGVLNYKIETQIRYELVWKMHHSPTEHFDNLPVGVYFSRLIADMKDVTSFAYQFLHNVLSAILLTIGGLTYIFLNDLVIGIIILSIMMISNFLYLIFIKKIAYHRQITKSLNTNINVQLGEQIEMITEIKSFDKSASVMKKFNEIQSTYLTSWKKLILKISAFQGIGIITSIAVSTVILIIGSFSLSTGQISANQLTGLILATNVVIIPMERIATTLNSAIVVNATIVRFKQFLDWNNEVNLGTKKDIQLGEIEFRNVDFSYDISGKKHQVFQNLNLVFESNKITKLEGLSGSGKTTILKLIMRYYDVERGEILIDGKNIKEYDLNFLRSHISYQSLIPKIFSNYLNDEEMFPNKKHLYDILETLDIVNLYEHVQKIDMVSNSQGLQISDGEKEMIALSRTLYCNQGKIFLFDSLGKSLDDAQIANVKKAIKKFVHNKTIIFIENNEQNIFTVDNSAYLK